LIKISKNANELIQKLMKEYPNTKLTVGIYHDENTSLKLFDVSGEIPYESHIYEIASITKAFTASLFAKYLHESKMDLNDSIAKYIPELEDRKYYPTLKRLATHTAGYKTEALTRVQIAKIYIKFFWNSMLKRQFYAPVDFYMDHKKIIWFAKQKKLQDKNYEYSYTNYSFALLGHGISQVAGKQFVELMEKFIKQDLGLDNTIFGTNRDGILSGYVNNVNVGNEGLGKGDCTAPAHFLTSNAEDLLAFARMNIEENPQYLGLCHNIYPINKKEFGIEYDIGLGWVYFKEKKPCRFFMSGGSEGFTSAISFVKEKNFAMAILTNAGSYKGILELSDTIMNDNCI